MQANRLQYQQRDTAQGLYSFALHSAKAKGMSLELKQAVEIELKSAKNREEWQAMKLAFQFALSGQHLKTSFLFPLQRENLPEFMTECGATESDKTKILAFDSAIHLLLRGVSPQASFEKEFSKASERDRAEILSEIQNTLPYWYEFSISEFIRMTEAAGNTVDRDEFLFYFENFVLAAERNSLFVQRSGFLDAAKQPDDCLEKLFLFFFSNSCPFSEDLRKSPSFSKLAKIFCSRAAFIASTRLENVYGRFSRIYFDDSITKQSSNALNLFMLSLVKEMQKNPKIKKEIYQGHIELFGSTLATKQIPIKERLVLDEIQDADPCPIKPFDQFSINDTDAIINDLIHNALLQSNQEDPLSFSLKSSTLSPKIISPNLSEADHQHYKIGGYSLLLSNIFEQLMGLVSFFDQSGVHLLKQEQAIKKINEMICASFFASIDFQNPSMDDIVRADLEFRRCLKSCEAQPGCHSLLKKIQLKFAQSTLAFRSKESLQGVLSIDSDEWTAIQSYCTDMKISDQEPLGFLLIPSLDSLSIVELVDNHAKDMMFDGQHHNSAVSFRRIFLNQIHESIIEKRQIVLDKQLQNEKFKELFLKFSRINRGHGDRNHYRCPELFFMKFMEKISFFERIMGNQVFKWLSDKLANTVLTLERCLQNLPPPSEAMEIFLKKTFQEMMVSGSFSPKDWENLILNAALIEKIRPEYLLSLGQREHSPIDCQLLLKEMNLILAQSVLFDVSESEIPENLFQFISPDLFVKLVNAKEKMSSDKDKETFREMLKRDLLGQSIRVFLHESASEIARHNGRIFQTLQASGIDADLALTYTEEYQFTYHESEYFAKAHDAVKMLKERLRGWQAQGDFCGTLPAGFHEWLSEADLKKQFEQKNVVVIRKLSTMTTHVPPHVIEACKAYLELAPHLAGTDARRHLSPPSVFTVKQWDKDHPRTFFLGDDVGCCLATDSFNFQAMVQRRMDDAMLMHTAVDQQGKVAAVVWLYFAQSHDEQIYLIGNFIDINARYGSQPELRKVIVDELLKFTDRYSKQIGLSNAYVLLDKMEYYQNFNHDHVAKYPGKYVELKDKVGGAYVSAEYAASHPELKQETEAYKRTQNLLYLPSLRENEFAVFVAPHV